VSTALVRGTPLRDAERALQAVAATAELGDDERFCGRPGCCAS
jgi:hypothetical protein